VSSDFEHGFDFEAAERQLRAIETGGLDHLPLSRRIMYVHDMGLAVAVADRLEIFQEVRRAEVLPEHISFYLVAYTVIGIAEELDDSPDMQELEDRMAVIRSAHGLAEGEHWIAGDEPAGYRRLQREYGKLWDARTARVMREHGEPDLAAMYLENRDEFSRRFEEGRCAIFGPIPPMFGGDSG